MKISFWLRKKLSGSSLLKDAGFSLVELLIVLMLFCLLGSIGLMGSQELFMGIKANQSMQQTVSQLRHGRQMAIAQRRSIQLQFLDDNRIQLVRNDPDGSTTTLSTVTLARNYQFIQFGEIGIDTPDGLGGGTAVYFEGANTYTFRSDGTLVDQNRIPVNGTISIGQPGHPEAARAVTIVGATGRVRGYRWTGHQWIE
jgi:prepilin-type N-terminal cleavage/methylation domain-containing protein